MREVRLPVLVVAVDGLEDALCFLSREGSFSDLGHKGPNLVLIAPSASGTSLSSFLRSARKLPEARPIPIVVLVEEVEDCVLNWYTSGANSIVATKGVELSSCIGEICLYWLVHNRTPTWSD